MTRYLSAAVAVLVLVFCCGRTVAAPVPAQPFDADGGHAVKSLIRVDFTSPQVTVPLEQVLRTWDVAGSADTGQSLDLVVTSVERRLLETAGVPFKVLIEDIEAEQSIGRASYHSFPEMEAVLSALATDYPNITQLSSLGQSWQGREIWCLEISDNPGLDEGEVGVMFMGLHHAREWPTLEICLEIADRLTSGYGSDPTITDLVNNRRVWVIPCVNPDGYVYCHDQGHDWRKNRRYFPEFGTYGVDLNRNYAGSSDGDQDGPWGSIGPASVSHNSDTEVYCGPWPFSEVETQAIQGLVDAHDVTILITYHTHGELVLWPWGYDTGAHTDDNALLTSIGQGIASQIAKQYGGTYDPMQSANLYPTTGDTADWAYGYRYYELGKNTLPYTIEMCASFHPSEYQLQSILDENWDGALYALQEAADAANQLIPYVLPPFLSTPQQDSDGNFTVSWVQQNPEAEANLYELHELTGLSRLTDGAEGGAGNWSTQYFSTSTQRKHSGSYSFKSSPGDQRTAVMTTIEPLPVEDGDALTFWTWYETEADWDVAIVEVSTDGRFFEVLDKFTGSSNGWREKTYPLDAYVGRSIYIRFRYTTDAYQSEEGFYVDDIYPVASWASITTLSDDITETWYEITDRPEGDYYYRVRGSNPQRGFGEFSDLGLTQVTGEIPGDLNGDGCVDQADLGILLADWGCTGGECPGDCDDDGDTDHSDLGILLAHWGEGC